MPWTYTPEQILAILAAAGVFVGTVVKGVQIILTRINEMQEDSRKRTIEVKAQVATKTSVIEEKVDVVKVQSDGRLSSIEAELRAARNESLAMARELSLLGELRRQEETTRRRLADETAEALQVDAAAKLAHAQAAQQHAPATVSAGPEVVESVTVVDPSTATHRIILP